MSATTKTLPNTVAAQQIVDSSSGAKATGAGAAAANANASLQGTGEFASLPIAGEASALQKLSTETALALGRRQAWYDFRSSAPLLVGDVLIVTTALTVINTIQQTSGVGLPTAFIPCIVILVALMQWLHGLYPASGCSYSQEFRGIVKTAGVVAVGSAIGLLMRSTSGALPVLTWSVMSLWIFVGLAAVRPMIRRALAGCDWWTQPVVVVGNGGNSRQLYERLERCRHEGLRPAGIVFDPTRHWDGISAEQEPSRDIGNSNWRETDGGRVLRIDQGEDNRRGPAKNYPPKNNPRCVESRWLGPVTELESIMLGTGATRLALAEHDVGRWKEYQSFHSIPHVMMPMDLTYHPTESVRLAERGAGIELHCYSALTNPHARIAKRAIDLVLVIGTAPLWLPLMTVIAIAIKIFDPGPVFYYQHRVGRYRKPFRAIKFRSMVCDADKRLQEYLDNNPNLLSEWKRTHKLKHDPRVTRVGRFLRTTSLDEFPQLFNVLSGEMSLVGPRPIIDSGEYDREYIQQYPEVFELYQMVRPGITGLWQVSGRNSTAYTQRVFMDRFYLHNWSITLDLFILWRTIKTALLREGAC